MQDNINEYILQIRGGGSIAQPLKTDQDYRLGLDVSVVSAEKRSNQDGTYNIIFKCKLLTGEVLKSNGETILMKSKSKYSQAWRLKIKELGYDYDETMRLMLSMPDEIIDLLYNR